MAVLCAQRQRDELHHGAEDRPGRTALHRVRRRGITNGNLSPTWKTLFGTSAYGAHYVNVNRADGLAVGTDGTVYVSEQDGTSSGIFKISPGGVILPFLNGAPVGGEGLVDPKPGDTNITAQIQGDQGKLATDVTTYWGGPTSLLAAQDHSTRLSIRSLPWP